MILLNSYLNSEITLYFWLTSVEYEEIALKYWFRSDYRRSEISLTSYYSPVHLSNNSVIWVSIWLSGLNSKLNSGNWFSKGLINVLISTLLSVFSIGAFLDNWIYCTIFSIVFNRNSLILFSWSCFYFRKVSWWWFS